MVTSAFSQLACAHRDGGDVEPFHETGELTGDAAADMLLNYRDPSVDTWRAEDLPRLIQFPIKEMAAVTGISERRLRDIYVGRATPRLTTKERLCGALAALQSLES